ncbi:MAG: S41 family peptidase [Saprospiraceae bacterium]|nr:S41 family peptidase [Saprospiraceae bacterium]
MKKIQKKTKLLITILAISILSVGSFSFINSDFEISKNLDVFATLFKQLNIYYVDDVNSGELMKTAIDEMLQSLDPYTNYIAESELEDYKFMTTGMYGGIGSTVFKRDDYVYISEPYEGFPAEKEGLIAGDKILGINGKPTRGKSVSDISNVLKGQAGTEVTLLIEREGLEKAFIKKIKRVEVKIDNIPYYGLLEKDIAYIKLNGFTQNAGKEVKDAFMEIKEKKAPKGVIIDLRDNGGGLLIEAVNIVNIFVKKGESVVSTKGRIQERNNDYKTLNQPIDTEIPIVILTNNRSASASEIVAGAIQDIDRGIIIGDKTYGKGLVQNVVDLSYNSKLKVTVAKYYIPSGRCIQAIDYSHNGSPAKVPDSLKTAFKTKNGRVVYDGGGIEPDVKIEADEGSNISYSLITKFLIFDYASKYKREHPEKPDLATFQITDEIYKDFTNYISDKDYDYKTKSEEDLKALKETAKQEKYFEDIEKEYDVLMKKMIDNKKDDLKKFKNEISLILKSEIISRYYYQKGRIQTSLNDDKDIAKAIEVLSDNELYKKIIEGSGSGKR